MYGEKTMLKNFYRELEKGKRQNNLRLEDIAKIVDTYRERTEEERYARRVSMEEIAKLNIEYFQVCEHIEGGSGN
jgi:type I restriction-modification system DNA methylase subunit